MRYVPPSQQVWSVRCTKVSPAYGIPSFGGKKHTFPSREGHVFRHKHYPFQYKKKKTIAAGSYHLDPSRTRFPPFRPSPWLNNKSMEPEQTRAYWHQNNRPIPSHQDRFSRPSAKLASRPVRSRDFLPSVSLAKNCTSGISKSNTSH